MRDELRGREGEPGQDGRDGKDADPAVIKSMVEEATAGLAKLSVEDAAPYIDEAVSKAVETIPRPTNGRDGKDGQPGRDGINGKNAISIPGRDGKDGEPGPMGPMPDHRWQGTKLQFENPDFTWGEAVDLQGPPGKTQAPVYVGGGGSKPDDVIDDSGPRLDRTYSSARIEELLGTTPSGSAHVPFFMSDGRDSSIRITATGQLPFYLSDTSRSNILIVDNALPFFLSNGASSNIELVR